MCMCVHIIALSLFVLKCCLMLKAARVEEYGVHLFITVGLSFGYGDAPVFFRTRFKGKKTPLCWFPDCGARACPR
jgi:single-stranded DNA-specific DHH superfamily exonuclease